MTNRRSTLARVVVIASYVVAVVPALARVDALSVAIAAGMLVVAVRYLAVASGAARRAQAAALAATVAG